eukprot:8476206-Ditylum_brightwellii.AAC.1
MDDKVSLPLPTLSVCGDLITDESINEFVSELVEWNVEGKGKSGCATDSQIDTCKLIKEAEDLVISGFCTILNLDSESGVHITRASNFFEEGAQTKATSHVTSTPTNGPEASLAIESSAYYPISFQQEQMCILDASGAGVAYNMPWILDLKGNFDKAAMLAAHDFVIKREQPLCTIVRQNNTTGQFQQRVLPKIASRECWKLCEHVADSYEDAIEIFKREQDFIFDLKR